MKTSTLFTTIYSYITKQDLISPNSTLIVGLSGGPDSVFLLHLLIALQKKRNLKIIAAHLDHEWRIESCKDEQFCKTLADSLQSQYVSQKISKLDFAAKFDGSKEAYARNARRYFLQSIQKQYNAEAIALAHHAQDQQETFFIRLLRGASLSGLVGMQPKNNQYIRPLLTTNKADIVDYLNSNNIAYLTDPTNASDSFLRNRIRNSVIPALTKVDSRFNSNFARTRDQLQQTEDFLQKHTAQVFESIAQQKEAVWHVSFKQLLAQHPALQYRLLVHWFCQVNVQFTPSQSFFDEVLRFLQSNKSNEHRLHTNWKLKKYKQIVYVLIG